VPEGDPDTEVSEAVLGHEREQKILAAIKEFSGGNGRLHL